MEEKKEQTRKKQVKINEPQRNIKIKYVRISKKTKRFPQ